MDFIIDAIVEWLKGLLVDGIMGNLDGLFDNVNQSVGEIATQVGTSISSIPLPQTTFCLLPNRVRNRPKK